MVHEELGETTTVFVADLHDGFVVIGLGYDPEVDELGIEGGEVSGLGDVEVAGFGSVIEFTDLIQADDVIFVEESLF